MQYVSFVSIFSFQNDICDESSCDNAKHQESFNADNLCFDTFLVFWHKIRLEILPEIFVIYAKIAIDWHETPTGID